MSGHQRIVLLFFIKARYPFNCLATHDYKTKSYIPPEREPIYIGASHWDKSLVLYMPSRRAYPHAIMRNTEPKVVCLVVHLNTTRWISCLQNDFHNFEIKIFLNNLSSIGYIVYTTLHSNT